MHTKNAGYSMWIEHYTITISTKIYNFLLSQLLAALSKVCIVFIERRLHNAPLVQCATCTMQNMLNVPVGNAPIIQCRHLHNTNVRHKSRVSRPGVERRPSACSPTFERNIIIYLTIVKLKIISFHKWKFFLWCISVWLLKYVHISG